MTRGKAKIALIRDQRAQKGGLKKRMNNLMKKANELTMLCNLSACLIFFSREDKKLVVWPSPEEATSLIKKFYSLSDPKRNVKAMDKESYIKTNMQNIEKKLADSKEVIAELEMDHLMFQIRNGRQLSDLSLIEVDKLISYSNDKITMLKKKLHHPSVNEPSMVIETPRACSNVAFQWGRTGVRGSMGSGSIYLFDKWFSDDECKVQNHCNETHFTPMVKGRFDLNLEPPEDEDYDVKIYKGESSKNGFANYA